MPLGAFRVFLRLCSFVFVNSVHILVAIWTDSPQDVVSHTK